MGFDTFVAEDYNQGRFATEDEIYGRFSRLDYRDSSAETGGINIISNGTQAVIDNTDNSTMVVGATGSKKTRTVVIPYVMANALEGCSMIIHDCKRDIYRYTYHFLKKHGYKIRVLDYRTPECGECYNPLEIAARMYKSGNKSRANEMFKNFADTIFSSFQSDRDPFWHLTSASYFSGLAAFASELFPAEDVTIDNIFNLHLQGSEKSSGTLYFKEYFNGAGRQEMNCWKRIYPTVTAATETRNSIISVFTSCLDTFVQNDAIVDQTSHSTFQVADLVEEKTAVFIVSRDEGSVYNNLITAVLDQFYEILIDAAENNGGCLNRKVKFVLDEFGNLAGINDIEKKVSLSRARGITWLLVCQSLEQLTLVYGKERSLVILGNCNNLVYLYSPDLSLVIRISALCGYRMDEITGQKVELCSVDQLRHLDKERGECLLLLDRMHPFVTHLPDVSEYYGVKVVKKVGFPKRKIRKKRMVHFKELVEEERMKRLNDYFAEEQKKRENMGRMDEPYSKEVRSDKVISIIDAMIEERGIDSV